ncbi:hypothetical protein N7449_004995 [Penicillium cf. viridicatum]|uniref:Uncharacterized protein n=1 Tax=Penicillium cf. viridicatum TaxID=2972119 RepID=A0A9W9MK99_9EURO|nr:hypothetical protein N7449_004995 [Penicillium cf. viridicatum]
MPILALLVTGRGKLPPGPFQLGRIGPWLNWVSIYYIITTIFFLFPGSANPAPSDMSFAFAVFGIILVIALLSGLSRVTRPISNRGFHRFDSLRSPSRNE